MIPCPAFRAPPRGPGALSWRQHLLPLLVLLALLRAPPAAAAAADRRPRAQLHLDPCTGVDGAEVERIFTIELGARLSADEPAADTSQLYVTCGDNGAELRVDDPLTGKSLFRVIDVAAAPLRARPRLLALALAELLFTSWTELEISLQPDPPEDPRVLLPDGQPLAPAPARSAAGLLVRQRLPPRQAPSAWRFLGLFASQGFRTTGPLLGGGVRIGGDYAHHLGFDADFLGHHGQATTALGEVTVDTLCAGAALLLQGRVLRATLRGGAGLRGGAARLIGVPADPQKGLGATLWGPFVGPMAFVGAGAPLPAHLVVELSLEAGYVISPVGGRVDGQRAVAVEGPWLGAQLGVGLRP